MLASGSVEVCYEEGALPCADLDQFTANSDELIVSFAWRQLRHRSTARACEPVAVGTSASARVFVSYRMVNPDSPAVADRGVSATTTTALGAGASYVNPNGRQVDESDRVGPGDIESSNGAQTTFLLTFPSSDPGGRLFWSGERREITALSRASRHQPSCSQLEATTQTTVGDGFRQASSAPRGPGSSVHRWDASAPVPLVHPAASERDKATSPAMRSRQGFELRRDRGR